MVRPLRKKIKPRRKWFPPTSLLDIRRMDRIEVDNLVHEVLTNTLGVDYG